MPSAPKGVEPDPGVDIMLDTTLADVISWVPAMDNTATVRSTFCRVIAALARASLMELWSYLLRH
ncbi:hypothetical protein [Mycobacterium uberis]|uniref:hypothetical protein n=1 Tax=Mycobacterium uberis TaxID=2162698 RepID=UPI000E308E12|nr:hypothetical protein [Mycobacterium uberis]